MVPENSSPSEPGAAGVRLTEFNFAGQRPSGMANARPAGVRLTEFNFAGQRPSGMVNARPAKLNSVSLTPILRCKPDGTAADLRQALDRQNEFRKPDPDPLRDSNAVTPRSSGTSAYCTPHRRLRHWAYTPFFQQARDFATAVAMATATRMAAEHARAQQMILIDPPEKRVRIEQVLHSMYSWKSLSGASKSGAM